jgi:pyridoxine/pyridoxamine 5'-phosphate oxidase
MDSLSRHEDYGQELLDEADLLEDPIEQFKLWLKEAEQSNIYEPNALKDRSSKGRGSRGVLLCQQLPVPKGGGVRCKPIRELCFWLVLDL